MDEATKTGPQRGRVLLDQTAGMSETELVGDGGGTAREGMQTD